MVCAPRVVALGQTTLAVPLSSVNPDKVVDPLANSQGTLGMTEPRASSELIVIVMELPKRAFVVLRIKAEAQVQTGDFATQLIVPGILQAG